MDGRYHRRNERSTTTYLLDSDDIARLISELLDATTDADPAWRDQVPGLIRLVLDSNAERNEAPLLEAIGTAWQGARTLAHLVGASVSGGAGRSREARGELRPGV